MIMSYDTIHVHYFVPVFEVDASGFGKSNEEIFGKFHEFMITTGLLVLGLQSPKETRKVKISIIMPT